MNNNIIAKFLNIIHILLILIMIIISLFSKDRYKLYFNILLIIYIISGWIIIDGCWLTILENYLNNTNLDKPFFQTLINKYTNLNFSRYDSDKIQIIQIILYNLFLIICIYRIEKISN